MKRSDAAGLAVIVAAWGAAIATVAPRGDFPMHDDWDFASAAFDFARTGRFHFTNFTAVSLRAQVLWGALWTKLFGESFHVLRASTLLLSLATLLIVHRTLARAGAPPWLRVAGPLALLFHPIFLWASCTFMTEIPYVFASAVSLYFFVRAVTEERLGLMLAGCAAVIVSWFVRQNGVVNLLPPLAVLIYQRPRRWRSLSAPLVATAGIFALVMLLRPEWLSGAPAMFRIHYQMWLESSFRLPQQFALLFHYLGFNAVNCGLYFLPLTLPLVMMRTRSRRALVLLALVAALIGYRTVWLGAKGYLVPYSAKPLFSDILAGPTIVDFGVGPTNIAGDYPFALPHGARIGLTIAAALLATLLVCALALARGNAAFQVAVASVVFGTLMLFASGFYYDRYALDSAWALAIVLPLIVPWQKPAARVLAIAALVAMAVFSTFAVREDFAWNRARWQAWNDLRARGVAASEIEGGAEAFGLYELRTAPAAMARRAHPPRPYVITFTPLPGYRVVARYPFRGFLGMHRADVLVLAR